KRFGSYQHLDRAGSQIMLNYRNGKPGRRLDLQSVLAGNFQADWVRDRIVLIGYTAPVARDEFSTPYGTLPGVWIHAHATSHLLSAAIDRRPSIRAIPIGAELLWMLVWALAGAGTAWGWRSRYLQSLLTMSILTAGIYQGCLLLLVRGIWISSVPAAIALWLTWGVGSLQFHRPTALLSSSNNTSTPGNDEGV
ncbi:MAG: CHASE2 domain-containing protein, partial [Cyanobacteria bacterium J06641_5]